MFLVLDASSFCAIVGSVAYAQYAYSISRTLLLWRVTFLIGLSGVVYIESNGECLNVFPNLCLYLGDRLFLLNSQKK